MSLKNPVTPPGIDPGIVFCGVSVKTYENFLAVISSSAFGICMLQREVFGAQREALVCLKKGNEGLF